LQIDEGNDTQHTLLGFGVPPYFVSRNLITTPAFCTYAFAPNLAKETVFMKLRIGCTIFGLLALVLSLVQLTFAQTSTQTASALPRLIRLGATVKDLNGTPLIGLVGITFALYSEQSGGAALWLETQNVIADSSGHYNALLGSTKPEGLQPELFTSEQARWLGVQVSGQPEQPRVLLVSVPYALKAGDAETVGGLPPSAFVLAAPPLGTTSVATLTAPTTTAQQPLTGATPVTTAGGTVNKLAKFDATADISNSEIFDNGTNVGVGNTAPVAKLDVSGTGIFRGALSLPAVGTANATAGTNSQPFNFAASSFSSSTKAAVNETFRWQAEPTGNNTATPLGNLNLLFGSGTAAPTETGLSISNKGVIAFASGQTFPSSVGTVKSVGLSAPSSDFTVSGSPVTTGGTLGLNWKAAPTSADTANAIVRRDANGSFIAGAITANGAIIANGTLFVSGAVTATSGVASNGPITTRSTVVTNPGVFTNTQMNEYLSSVIGGINLGTAFSGLQGPNFATEGVAGGVALPSGATVHNGNGIGGYAQSACNSVGRTVCNVVGLYGQATDVSGSNGAGIWGGNVVAEATGASSTNTNVTGWETDVNLAAGATPFWVVGHIITGAGTGTMPSAFIPGSSTAVGGSAAEAIVAPRLGSPSSYAWPLGLDFFRGSVSGAAVQIDGTCIAGGGPCASATLTFTGWDGSNVGHTAAILADSSGDLVLQGATNRPVQLPAVAFANLPSANNGSTLYCPDCKNVVDNAATAGAACLGSGSGAFAKRENNRWDCN
jgi:hypothetical protein